MVASVLSAGAVAIVSYETDISVPASPDGLRFVLLQPIGAGTQIFFTDRFWTGSAFTNAAGDGTYTYTAGADLPAGTVITLTAAQLSAAGITLSNAGETIYAYQGAANAPTTFLFAADVADGDTTFGAGALANTGLTAGVNAVALASDNATFVGTQTGIAATTLAAIANNAQWYGSNTDDIGGTTGYSEVIVTDVSGPLLDGSDFVIVAGFAGGGQSEGILRIGAEDGALAAQNVALILRDRGDIERIDDVALDLDSGYFFIADSDGNGADRIVRGNIADLVSGNQTAVLTQIALTSGAGGAQFIGGIEADPGSNQIYWWYGDLFGWGFYRVGYGGGAPELVATLDSENVDTSFGFSGGMTDWALDLTNRYAYAISNSAQIDGLGNATVFHNHIVRVDLDAVDSITVLPLGAADPRTSDGGGNYVDGRLDPSEGIISALDVDQTTGIIYFVTQPISASGNGGVWSYDPATDTLVELWNQPAPNAFNTLQTFPTSNMWKLEVDEIGHRLFISTLNSIDHENDATPATNEHDASIHVLEIGAPVGTAPTRFVRYYEPTALGAPSGMEINYDSDLSVSSANATYTESTNALSSPAGAGIAIFNNTTINDPDQSTLYGATVAITSGLLAGDTLSFTQSGGITGSYNATTGVVTFTGQAGFAAYETVLDSIRFTNAGDNPTDYGNNVSRTISITVFDGLVHSDVSEVTVNVTGINDTPVIGNTGGPTRNVNEDNNLAIAGLSVSDVDADPANQDIQVTFSVANGGLTIRTDVAGGIIGTDVPSNGASVIIVTATQNQINATLAASNGLVFTPSADYNGVAGFSMSVSDLGLNGDDPGTGDPGSEEDTIAISVDVAAVADITGDSLTTDEDTAITANVLTGTNGATADNFEASPTVTSTTQGSNGSVSFQANGDVTYTPDAEFSGTDSFTYTVTSGGVDETATVTVTVNAVNDAPVLDDNASPQLNFVNELSLPPAGPIGTLVSSLVDLADGSGLDNVSDPDPLAVSGIALTGTTGGGTWHYSTDDGANWNVVGAVTDSSALLLSADSATRLFYEPMGGEGTLSSAITFRAWDRTSGSNGQAGVDASVNGGATAFSAANDTASLYVNAPPSTPLDSDAGQNEVSEGAATGTAVGLTVSSTDPDGGITYSISSDSSGGGFQIDSSTGVVTVADGTLLDFETAASHSIFVVVTDGLGLATGDTFTISLLDTNDNPPVITSPSSANVVENIPAGTPVYYADVNDPDTVGTLTFSLGGPDAALFSICNCGGVSFNASPNYEQPLDSGADNVYDIVVNVDDGVNAVASQAVSITVQQAPNATVNVDSASGFSLAELIDVMDALFSGGPTNIASTSFNLAGAVNGQTATATVTGTNFAELLPGTGLLVAGTITGISVALDNDHQFDVTTSIDAFQYFQRFIEEFTAGDPAAIENYLQSFNWTFLGIGVDDIAEQGLTVGFDAVSFNLAGDDRLLLDGGNDRVFAGNGDDFVYGFSGTDVLDGGAGRDYLWGGIGGDQLIGGAGIDFARYDDADYGNLTIRLDNSTLNSGAAAAGDTYDGIEGLIGGSGNDLVVGNNNAVGASYLLGVGGNDALYGLAGVDVLDGGEGNDYLWGGLGGDILIGGAGIDFARYDDADYGNLVVRIDQPNLNTGAAAGDTYAGIEGIIGGAGDDALFGSNSPVGAEYLVGLGGADFLYGLAGVDVLDGGEGNDHLWGGFGGDVHIGGAGNDFARYDEADYGNLTIRLDQPNLNTGAAAGDSYVDIEGIIGGDGIDTIFGNAANNFLFGGNNNDVIDGLSGSDFLNGNAGADRFVFSTALNASTNVDTIFNFESGVDEIALSQSIFGAIGPTLDAGELTPGFGAGDGNDFVRYIAGSGLLFYDANGGSTADAVLFATVAPNTVLDINDFVMVA